jgi:HlyD family secretion protein
MFNKRMLIFSIGICLLGIIAFRYHKKKSVKQVPLFTTGHASPVLLTQRIKATGVIEPKELMKIGSLVSGVVKKMYVEENTTVTAGQLLAEIDDGIADTDVRASQARMVKAYREFLYQKNNYARNLKLYEKAFLSEDQRERLETNYRKAGQELVEARALYDQKLLAFNNKTILAPEAGLVIGKISAEGETVTLTSPPTLLYTIAKDLDCMEVKIDIDESSISLLVETMEAELIFDAYPDRAFFGHISSLRNAPVTQGSSTSYKAIIPIDNAHRAFRPGMNVTAIIIVAEARERLSVPGYIFSFSRDTVSHIAKSSGYNAIALSDEQQKMLRSQGNMKTVWIVQGKDFIETPVEVGVNNGAFFEVVSGLSEEDAVIFEIEEPDAMKEFFQKFFKKGL